MPQADFKISLHNTDPHNNHKVKLFDTLNKTLVDGMSFKTSFNFDLVKFAVNDNEDAEMFTNAMLAPALQPIMIEHISFESNFRNQLDEFPAEIGSWNKVHGRTQYVILRNAKITRKETDGPIHWRKAVFMSKLQNVAFFNVNSAYDHKTNIFEIGNTIEVNLLPKSKLNIILSLYIPPTIEDVFKEFHASNK